ncbi:GNAT family N-acetyltransferase [Amycolatopsis thermoflava]|uniref:GNAT family N-acetyltransferase n=1 Tax=Amycolatopsis thermoflava TaxID=84480 RepID=UPI003655DDF3
MGAVGMLGRVEEIVTHLEMTSRADLRPAPPVPGVAVEPIPADSPLVRPTTVRIGEPYNWPSSRWSDDDWEWYLSREGRHCVLIRHLGEIAGLADYQSHGDGEVEITTFGLVPEYVGKGIGGYALTLAVEQAWHLPLDVRRVWLHTSDLDHPLALPNYHRRGFRTFRTARGQR